MSAELVTNLDDIDDFFSEYMSNVEDAIINQFCYIGECCIVIGRSTNSYKDQTSNLRNSIGYVVVKDGQVIHQVTSTKKCDGAEKGRKFIKELVKECGSGIYLIVVAGMPYSRYVSAKGYDVLDSAELEAERLVKELVGR